MHKNIAYAQDLIVEDLYNFFPEAVIHGGTAIWRCYHGNRFSEDIDIYIKKNKTKIENFFKNLKNKGFTIIKKRIKENSLYSVLKFNRTLVRLEATFQTKPYILKEYETSESILINIYTLSPEEIIKEKINTYIKRNKIRDLYDIFFLLREIKNKNKISKELKKLITKFKEPIDEEELKILIIEGPIPNVTQMLDYIKRWAK